MAKIVVTNRIFPEVERRLRALGEVIINDRGAPWSRDELVAQLHEAEAMLAFMTDAVDADLLSRCPRLKIVAGALKGHDSFDVEACTRAGVWLTVVSDLLTIPTAELAIALTLGLNRNLLAGDDWVRSGHFDGWRAEFYGFGLSGADVGIAGLGRVGLAVAERLTGFGACLHGFDARPIARKELASRRLSQVEWNELIAESDVIILALPLNERTFHMIDAQSLSRMRRGSRLVNIGRGSVVDEEAVAQSLEQRHLGGYAADVFEMEDWARDERPRAVSPRLLAPRRTAPRSGNCFYSAISSDADCGSNGFFQGIIFPRDKFSQGIIVTPKFPRRFHHTASGKFRARCKKVIGVVTAALHACQSSPLLTRSFHYLNLGAVNGEKISTQVRNERRRHTRWNRRW